MNFFADVLSRIYSSLYKAGTEVFHSFSRRIPQYCSEMCHGLFLPQLVSVTVRDPPHSLTRLVWGPVYLAFEKIGKRKKVFRNFSVRVI
jgi:hypothetical protein